MWNYQRQENTISEMSPFMGNFNNRLKKRSLNLKIMALESIQTTTSSKSIQTAKHFINFIILNGLTFVARAPEGEERGQKEEIFKEGMVKNF